MLNLPGLMVGVVELNENREALNPIKKKNSI
jgi:hypothetical protein